MAQFIHLNKVKWVYDLLYFSDFGIVEILSKYVSANNYLWDTSGLWNANGLRLQSADASDAAI